MTASQTEYRPYKTRLALEGPVLGQGVCACRVLPLQTSSLERTSGLTPVGMPGDGAASRRQPSDKSVDAGSHVIDSLKTDTSARRGWLQQSQPLILRPKKDDKLACSARRQRRRMHASMAALRTQNEQEGHAPVADNAGEVWKLSAEHGVRSETSRLVRRYTDAYAAWKGTATPEVPYASVADRVPRVYRKGVRIWSYEQTLPHLHACGGKAPVVSAASKTWRSVLDSTRGRVPGADELSKVDEPLPFTGDLRGVKSPAVLKTDRRSMVVYRYNADAATHTPDRGAAAWRATWPCQTSTQTIPEARAERDRNLDPRVHNGEIKGGDREAPEGGRCI
jgi:hypothetical protein